MILVSIILVVISAVALLIGGLGEGLGLIYVSIGAALAAGLFLLLGVLQRSRRDRTPRAASTVASPDGAPAATWRAAATGADEAALSRDELDGQGAPAAPGSEAAPTAAPTPAGDATPQPPASAPRPAPTAGVLPPPSPAAAPAPAPTPPPTAPPATTGGSWAPPPPPTAPPGAPGGPPPPPA